MKKYIWLFLFLLPLTGCSLFQPAQTINYVTDTIGLPAMSMIYPNPDKMEVLEDAFSASKMEWTDNELATIALFRNSLKGIFWYLDQEADLSAVPLYKAKDAIEQGRAYYKGLKAILSTRRIKLSKMQGIIYDDAVIEADRVLKEVSYSLSLRESELSNKSSSFDMAQLLSAWGAISPFVGNKFGDIPAIMGVLK